jgi:flagellar motor component MotA
MWRFIIGVALMIVTLLGATMLAGGDILLYVAVPALVLVFLVPIFSVFSIWNRRSWARAFRHAFGPIGTVDERRISANIWSLFEVAAYIAGLLGLFADIIITLMHLDPSKWALQIAASLTSPIYGIFVGLISRILKTRVENPSQK